MAQYRNFGSGEQAAKAFAESASEYGHAMDDIRRRLSEKYGMTVVYVGMRYDYAVEYKGQRYQIYVDDDYIKGTCDYAVGQSPYGICRRADGGYADHFVSMDEAIEFIRHRTEERKVA